MFFRLTFIFILLLLFSFGFVSNASAITVFSPVVELETEPGQTQEGVVKVYNETQETVFLQASIEGFAPGESAGQAVYLPPEEAGDHLNWFSLSQDELTLNSEQVAIVPFEIDVPSDTVPGGYYAVIFWSAAGDNQNNQIAVGSKVGTLIFIKVKGDLIEQGSIENFQVKPASVLYQLPDSFSFDFVNSGNIHLIPEGRVEITNYWGNKKILPINQERRFVLPGSTRVMEIAWALSGNSSFIASFFDRLKLELSNLAFGKHTATLKISYEGDQQNFSEEKIEFWVWPVRTIILIIAVILFFIFFIRINLKVKRLKKTLIENEQRQKK